MSMRPGARERLARVRPPIARIDRSILPPSPLYAAMADMMVLVVLTLLVTCVPSTGLGLVSFVLGAG